ncbi:PIN domain-containing protein [Dulcicalothrix desertica]|nr:PIN domain-containing protein [Dulcicalothrix desertica]TWH50733.1 putative nucleic acid-binding protein [Dulcicalothrix desertica PCC 7102]
MGNFSALLDACVIFPYSLSNVLLEAAYQGLYRVHFSDKILDEAIRNRVKRGRMDEVTADRFRAALIKGFFHALVEAPVSLEEKMENHPKDRHVLAAAVHAKVDVIVTSNLKDFPASSLAPWNMEVMHPDDFLNYLCNENGDDVLYDLISTQIAGYKKPPMTFLEFLSNFENEQPKFASRILIYAYSYEVEKFAINALASVTNAGKGQRVLSGNRYKISETNNEISIIEKSTKREVFRSCSDGFIGNLKVKDIEIFQEALKQLNEEGYS